ncbi:MAG: hypothetical protein RLZZ77_2522 [Bacteroidota bacterium]
MLFIQKVLDIVFFEQEVCKEKDAEKKSCDDYQRAKNMIR